MEAIDLPEPLSFEWDEGNDTKNLVKHKVSISEQEEAFFSKERIIIEDKKHSQQERRFLLLSKTSKRRKLLIAFTMLTRDGEKNIRAISARAMNRKEAKIYEETITMA